MTRLHRGFTLIEIAIALTVISLVLGGVLIAGNAMIERSRFAALLSKIKDLGVTARDFKARYGYFPGDLPKAGNLINSLSDGCKNNAAGSGTAPFIVGDGMVDSDGESTCALEHLVRAGLLSKVERDTAGKYILSSGFGTGQISLWFDRTTNENMIRITSLPCSIALELDRKLDNDFPDPLLTGIVRSSDTSGNIVKTCVVGGANDPVDLLVKY